MREGAGTVELVHEFVHALGKDKHPQASRWRIFSEQSKDAEFGELRAGLKKGLFHEESDAFGGMFIHIDEARGVDPGVVREAKPWTDLFEIYHSIGDSIIAKLANLAEAIPKLIPHYRRQANIITALWALAVKTGNERNPNFSMQAILDRVTTDEKAEAGSTKHEAGKTNDEGERRVDPVKAARLFYELMRECFGESDMSTWDIMTGMLSSFLQACDKGKNADEAIDSLISALEEKFERAQFRGRQEGLLAAMDGAADLGARGKARDLSDDRGYLADREMAKVVVDGWGGALRLVEKLRAEGRVGGRDFNRVLIDIAAHSENPRAGILLGKAAALARAQGDKTPEMMIDLAEGLASAGYHKQAVQALKDGLEMELKKENASNVNEILNSYIDASAKLPPAHRTEALSNLFEKWDPYLNLPAGETTFKIDAGAKREINLQQFDSENRFQTYTNLDKKLSFVGQTVRAAGKLLDMMDGLEGAAADEVRGHIKRLDETVREMSRSAANAVEKDFLNVLRVLLDIPAYFEEAMALIKWSRDGAKFLLFLLYRAQEGLKKHPPSQRLEFLGHVLSRVRKFAHQEAGLSFLSIPEPRRRPQDASDVYYFNEATRDLAEAAINAGDPDLRKFALRCLDELGRGKDSVEILSLHSQSFGQRLKDKIVIKYTPYEHRIESITEVLEKTENHAADTRPFIEELIEHHRGLAEGIKTWQDARTLFELTALVARTLFELAALVARAGHTDLAREAYRIGDEVYRRLEGQPSAKMSDALQGFEHAGRYIGWRAMIDAGEDEKMHAEAGSFIGELEADLNGRVRYFDHGLLGLSKLLDQHRNMAGIKERIFEQVIARHIGRWGSSDEKERRLQSSDLVRAIDGSNIPAEAKDRLLCKLIEGLNSLAATGGLGAFDALHIFMTVWKYAKTGRYPETDKLLYKNCSFLLTNLENAGDRVRHQDIMMALGEASGYIIAENPWLGDPRSFSRLWDINDSWEARRALAAIFPEEAKRAEPAILPDGRLNAAAAKEGFVDTVAFSAEVFARLSGGRLGGDEAREAVAAMISGAIISRGICENRVAGRAGLCGKMARGFETPHGLRRQKTHPGREK